MTVRKGRDLPKVRTGILAGGRTKGDPIRVRRRRNANDG